MATSTSAGDHLSNASRWRALALSGCCATILALAVQAADKPKPQPKMSFAVKIAAGKINAVSGEAWTAELQSEPQDHVVVPGQPWLDGFSVGEGLIRQFASEILEPTPPSKARL